MSNKKKRSVRVKTIPMKVKRKSMIQSFMEEKGKVLSECDELKGKMPEDIMSAIKFSDNHIHTFCPLDDKDLCVELIEKLLETLDLEIEPEEKQHKHNIEVTVDPDDKWLPELTKNLTEEVYMKATAERIGERIQLPKRIVFHNRQAIGDIIMFTAGVRDFKKAFPHIQVQVLSTVGHMWDHNPNINRDTWPIIIDPISFHKEDSKPTDKQMLELNKQAISKAISENKPVKLYIGPGKATNASNSSNNHFANAYRISMETVLGVTIPQGPIRGDLYMTEKEYNEPPLIKPPYWLITAGEKGDWGCKTFSFKKWEEVTERLPEITFIQIGAKNHKHPKLTGSNVINYIGKTEDRDTGLRNLLNLFNNCEGSMGLVSFQMHLAAVFNKPCVTIAGAREPVWFTRYPGQQYLATDGCLPCTVRANDEPTACWKCDITGCLYKEEIPANRNQNIPRCVDIISVDDVVSAIGKYYLGGRLSLNKPIGKSKLIQRVKESLKSSDMGSKPDKMWGFTWGGSSITDKDWEYIKAIVKETGAKSVLEIGAGFSTLLFKSLGLVVVSYETRQQDIDILKEIDSNLNVYLWDGKKEFGILDQKGEVPKFDLAFIDGPGGGENRGPAFEQVRQYSDNILIHDAGRKTEKEWIKKYLEEDFEKHSQGGHRTAFYQRKEIIEQKRQEKTKAFEVSDKPLIKVVFNGRGEGGAEHSTTWIMNEFIEKGWNVQYISPNPRPCGAFMKEGPSVFFFTDKLEEIQKSCDILFLYTNDWVWEFKTDLLKEAFSDLQAKRKVMAVNYRLGDIGNSMKAEWTLDWDKYLFLNTSLQNSLVQRVPDIDSVALAPPTDLSEYFKTNIDYSGNLRIVRHSSQGDVKYPKDFNEKVERILNDISDSEIFLMPAPSFFKFKYLPTHLHDRVHCHQRNKPSVKEFLAQGNVFWYHLPDGYHDQGPKTIMEAMSSGLPVVADNHSGAKDRVVDKTGQLCDNFDQHLFALNFFNTNRIVLEDAGKRAREHAKKTYDPERWIKEIIG